MRQVLSRWGWSEPGLGSNWHRASDNYVTSRIQCISDVLLTCFVTWQSGHVTLIVDSALSGLKAQFQSQKTHYHLFVLASFFTHPFFFIQALKQNRPSGQQRRRHIDKRHHTTHIYLKKKKDRSRWRLASQLWNIDLYKQWTISWSHFEAQCNKMAHLAKSWQRCLGWSKRLWPLTHFLSVHGGVFCSVL